VPIEYPYCHSSEVMQASKHVTLGTHLMRLARQTLGFSRSHSMHALLIGVSRNSVEGECPA